MASKDVNGSIAILVAEGSDLAAVAPALRRQGYRLQTMPARPEAARSLGKGMCDLVLMDLSGPENFVAECVSIVREADDERPIIGVAVQAAQKDLPRLVELGIYDVILAPLDANLVVARVNMLLRHKGLLVRPMSLEGGLREEPGFKKIVGSSARIQDVFRSIETVTASDVPVLVLGETGTGKELVARAVHYRGPRRRRPFFAVNCAAIPETLLESELFGHERGAFTSAVQQRKGKMEAADGGTLFLDEIVEMPLATQAKLLRVVEERVLQRLGGNDDIHIDVRMIAATNKDIKEEVEAGRFRKDLFYRLDVFPIILPPLRVRRNDIPDLVHYFLERAGLEMGREVGKPAAEAMQAMMDYDWPGNVRELQNAIRRAVLVAHGEEIQRSHLGLETTVAGVATTTVEEELDFIAKSLREGRILRLERVEDALIRMARSATQGNVSEAAEKLGISRSTIYRRLHAMQRR